MNKHSLDTGEPKLERSLETDSQCPIGKDKDTAPPDDREKPKAGTIWRPAGDRGPTDIQQDKGILAVKIRRSCNSDVAYNYPNTSR